MKKLMVCKKKFFFLNSVIPVQVSDSTLILVSLGEAYQTAIVNT